MSTTPNMNLNLPVPSTTTGPDWADSVNTAFDGVDAHDHTIGKGTQVPTAGLNIDADLSLNNNKATDAKAVSFSDQTTALTGPTDVNSVYTINGDLWYNNQANVPVQITSGSSITTPSSPVMPAGAVIAWAGVSTPSGYLMCDGADVDRTTYATLFAAIGTTYGAGNGSTTFTLPNLRGRVPVGAGTYTDPTSGSVTRSLGTVAGEEKHILTYQELASHSHTVNDAGHSHNVTSYYATGGSANIPSNYQANSGSPGGTSATSTSATGIALANTGNDVAHNNMQPYLVLNYIIKSS